MEYLLQAVEQAEWASRSQAEQQSPPMNRHLSVYPRDANSWYYYDASEEEPRMAVPFDGRGFTQPLLPPPYHHHHHNYYAYANHHHHHHHHHNYNHYPVASRSSAHQRRRPAVRDKAPKTHAEMKPSRVRPYAYVGMLKEKGDPLELWRAAVLDTWSEVFPGEELPQALDMSDAATRDKIVHLVQDLCRRRPITCFRPEALRLLIERQETRAFPTRDFLQLNATLSSTKLFSVESGVVCLLARAVGLEDYREMTNRDNVLKWYNRFMNGTVSE